jgi:S-adenosylmethionine uptake transporter
VKYLEQELHFFQVTFFLFAFSFITVLPAVLYKGLVVVRSKSIGFHLVRSVILMAATLCWYWGLGSVGVSTATVISFAISLFLLPLAFFFLKEAVNPDRVAATFIGFIGVLVVVGPLSPSFDPMTVVMLLGAFFYALLEIVNKRHLETEPIITMIFYSSLFASAMSVPAALAYWTDPSFFQLLGLACIGIIFNAILFFLLKALSLEDASFLAPLMYLEIVFSVIMGYLVFGEIPGRATLGGGFIIVAGSLYLIWGDRRNGQRPVVSGD